jgi:hypothetical protein
MEWYVTYQDFNSQKFKRVNILKYYEDFIKKLKKKVSSYDEFSKELKSEMMYRFWSKCEYEVVLKKENGRLYMLSWPPTEGEVGVDITEDRLFDWNGFFDKVIENRVSKTECKIDVYEQLRYRWDAFVEYCFLYRHKYQRQEERTRLLHMYAEKIS